MVRTVGSRFGLLLLTWLLLPVCTWAARCVWARGDAPSLCYTFTITPNRKPWYEIQGQFNENPFLKYTSSSNIAEPIGPLGVKVNATEAWKDQTVTLKDLMEELKKKLLDSKPAINIPRDSHSLQGRILCQQEANGTTRGSLELYFDGQRFLHFDLEKKKCAVDHSGDEWMKQDWENDMDLNMLFTIIPGHCKMWHDKFLEHWKKELSTTAPPTTVPATTQSKATTTALITFFALFIFLVLIIVGKWKCRNYRY
ncbi:PREDICTED: NKG2D ligand 1-like [Hipposideros armiger]|uniref:NKG2D ligand 1-like n=1 Tax=Hipposideros armiger TaxID=186990 RepID=A0A8B7R0H2_HIPAR|nr:PREDICTED: NKG2D ligand 1-like [Hipposideros armiger]